MPRCWPLLGWVQGSLKARAKEKAGSSFGVTGAFEPPGPDAPAAWRAFPEEAGAQQTPLRRTKNRSAWPWGSRAAGFGPEPPVPAWRLCASPGAPGALGWVQACWASVMSSPTERASAGAHNVALPSLPGLGPSETLVCKCEHAGKGRSGAGPVLLGVGTGARPPTPPPSGHPARAARPPHPQRNGNRFDR